MSRLHRLRTNRWLNLDNVVLFSVQQSWLADQYEAWAYTSAEDGWILRDDFLRWEEAEEWLEAFLSEKGLADE